MRLRLLASALFVTSTLLAQTAQPTQAPLTEGQILDLLVAGMESPRIVQTVKERGIDFEPTEEALAGLRSRGANDVLLDALRAQASPPVSKDELLQLVGKGESPERIERLLRQRGIDFEPTATYLDTLHIAGASEALLKVVQQAKQVRPAEVTPPVLKLPSMSMSGPWTTKPLPSGKEFGEGAYSAGGVVTAPVPTYKPDPPYSDIARKVGHEGSVVLHIVVDTKGNVTDARVVKPLGLGLDEKALETVRTWKFKPGMRNGVPVPVKVKVEVLFRILGSPQPLTKEQVLELVKEDLPIGVTSEIIAKHGINFDPTEQYFDTLRTAGAHEEIVEAVRKSKRVHTHTTSSAIPLPPSPSLCPVPFAFAEMDWNDPQKVTWDRFAGDVIYWWTRQGGSTKFPLLCTASPQAAAYAIVWRRLDYPYSYAGAAASADGAAALRWTRARNAGARPVRTALPETKAELDTPLAQYASSGEVRVVPDHH